MYTLNQKPFKCKLRHADFAFNAKFVGFKKSLQFSGLYCLILHKKNGSLRVSNENCLENYFKRNAYLVEQS